MTQQHKHRSFPLPLILFVGAGLATAGAVGYYTWDLATGQATASGEYQLTQSQAQITSSSATSTVVPLPAQENVPQTTPVAPDDALTGNTSKDDPLLPPHSRVGRTYLGLGDQPTTTWRARPDTATPIPTDAGNPTRSAEPSDIPDSSAAGSAVSSTTATVPTQPTDDGDSATNPDGSDAPHATNNPSAPTRPNITIPTLPSLIPAPLEPTITNPTPAGTPPPAEPSAGNSHTSGIPGDPDDRNSTAHSPDPRHQAQNGDSPAAAQPPRSHPAHNTGSVFIPDFLRNHPTETSPVDAGANRVSRANTPSQDASAAQSRANDSRADTASDDNTIVSE